MSLTAFTTINDADWQPLLGAIGETVWGPDEINQCIRIILETPYGMDPLRPDFGSNLAQWIDSPVHIAIPNIVKESVDAIRKWEPRVKVKNVIVRTDEVSNGRMKVEVYWTPKDGSDTYMVEIV